MERVIESIRHIAFGRRVFISHAREDAKIAERIALAVRGRNCKVFLDEHDLPPGGNYEARIHQAIKSSSVFVFLISPASVSEGRYPLTELKFAEQKWSHPADRVLPVPVGETPFESIPEYLRAASIMKPRGDVAAEVAAAVDAMLPKTAKLMGALAATLVIAIAGLSALYVWPRGTPDNPARVVRSVAPGQATPSSSEPALAAGISFPERLDLKFSLEPLNPDDPNLSKDQVYFSVQRPLDDGERRKLVLQDDGFYRQDKVRTPLPDEPFYAVFSRSPVSAQRVSGAPAYTVICLRRTDAPPETTARNQAVLRCKEGDQACKVDQIIDPGWLKAAADCRRNTEPRSPAGLPSTTRFASLFVTEAMAAPAGPVWTVPSLETLAEQKSQDRLRDGFTTFTIEAAADAKIEGDAISLDLRVNDTPILIEGLPADLRRRSLKPDQPLKVTFGLQNLDFDGRYAGCDRIEARLLFYKSGEAAGAPIVLPLYYAALRDAAPTEIATDRGKFTWSAAYELARPRDVQGRTQEEWRVFLTSAPVNQLSQLEKTREDIRGLGLVLSEGGQNYPVVAVVRPPGRGTAFGLALGMVQPSGQIQFTFGKDQAARLRSFAIAVRQRNPAARNLISDNPNLFIELANFDRHYACATPR
jgi:TIR domain